MARFEVRPIASQTKPDSWSHTLILSDTSHLLDAAVQPVWIIALSLSGEDSSEKGPKLLESIGDAYQQIELKIPEALYQTLITHLESDESASVAAICFTITNATIIGKGNFKTEIWRGSKQSTILAGNDQEWHIVEGAWHETDRWWLIAGDDNVASNTALLEESDIEKAAEILHAQMAVAIDSSAANVLIACNNTEPVQVEETLITPPAFLRETPDVRVINKRRVMAAGWIVLIILVISVFFGARARSEKILFDQYSDLENQANQSIASASALKTSDQVKARATLRELQDKISQTKTVFSDNKKWADKWESLNTSVNNAYQELAGEASLNELPEWFALSVVKSGFKGDQLVLVGSNVIILDKVSNTLVKIDIESKRAEVITGGETIPGSVYVAVDGNRAAVITNSGIKDVSLTRKTVDTLIEKDETWQNLQAISMFNGNVYLLDLNAGEIWRYPGVTSGVGPKQKWLGAGVTISSDTIVDMEVDGDLWLMQSTGTIKRYRRGAPLSFSFTGLDTPFSSSGALAVSPDQDIIAILDGPNQRIVRFDKQGNYQKQIIWAGLSEAQDIVLSPDGNSVYILKNGSIYTTSF